MDDVFERMRKRTEQLSGFFNRILSPKDSNVPGTSHTQTPQSTPLTDDIYDDTSVLGKNSRVLDWENCHPRRQMPSDSDKHEFEDKRPSPFEESGSLFPPGHGPESMLEKAFVGMFDSAFGGIIEEMNHAMSDMEAAFREFGNVMDEDNEDEDHRYSRFFGQGFPVHEMDDSAEDKNINTKKLIDPDANYRDQVLKREGDANAKNLVPRTWTSPSYPNTGSSPWNWSTSGTRTSTIYSSVNGKVSSQTTRETPEGREIITQRQNEQGVTEEHREFIPRKDLPPEQSIFTKLFRPKF